MEGLFYAPVTIKAQGQPKSQLKRYFMVVTKFWQTSYILNP